MKNTFTEDRGQNLFQTSTHTAHHWRPGYYFPSSNFEAVIMDPIPPSLNSKNQVLPNIHYTTTAKLFHDNKYPNQDLYNEALALKQVKPLPSYKVNYLYDVVEKLNAKPRRPLTMAFQKSEYKDLYEEHESELAYEFDRPIHGRNYLNEDEKTKQFTEVLYDGQVKPVVPYRKPIDPSQMGVFNLLDPYLTTYNKEHKKWRKDQQNGIAKKDAITIYDTEEAVKAWGFGTKTNPIDEVTEKHLPMKDDIWFKSNTKQRQIHNKIPSVPHGGMTTEARDNYITPSDVKAREAKICPIDTPFILPAHGSKSAYCAPGMYRSEYTNIGRGKLVNSD